MKSKQMKKMILSGIMVCLMVLLGVHTGYAASAVLSWTQPVADEDGTELTGLAGYKVHYGTESGIYTDTIDVGNVDTYVVDGLSGGETYYFAATAYDASGNDGPLSAEVDKTFPVYSTPAPVISNVQVDGVTDFSATISWTTDVPSDTRIMYGTTTSYGAMTTLDTSMVTDHNQNISGLAPSTLYHYKVISTNAEGNQTVSDDYTFVTSAPPGAVDYYCDGDGDGYAGTMSSGYCIGAGCEPEGCQTTPGSDCNDSDPGVSPAAADEICDGIDNNCDGIADNDYVSTPTSCGEGTCTFAGELTCVDGSIVDTCTIPAECTPETTTVINIGDNWKYQKGYTDPPSEWNTVSFDDSAWFEGPTGIGYGDGDDATVLSDMQYNYITVYARKTFNITNSSLVSEVILNIDFDDGFVAYLNGQEVARKSMPAGTPNHATLSTGSEAGTPVAFDLTSYKDYLVAGTNVLAIEVHNMNIDSSDLSLIPELTITAYPDVTPVDYYCDGDGDGYANTSVDGYCTGEGCEPVGCQTTPGSDCNDADAGVFPSAADEICDGVDNNCDGTADNEYVPTPTSCGAGECSSAGQLECQGGVEVDTCVPADPAETAEATCGDGLDNDCDMLADSVDPDCYPQYFYCDGDGDGHADHMIGGSCIGSECEAVTCEFVEGDDCDDSNPNVWNCDTPAGSVEVTITDDNGDAYVILGNVTVGGNTEVITELCQPGQVEGIEVTDTTVCADITSDAVYEELPKVCIHYDGTEMTLAYEKSLRIIRCDYDGNCELLPDYINFTGRDDVCAITESLGVFAIGIPLNSDSDDLFDLEDNCSRTYNPGQEDADIDGYGNACDADLDNDGEVGMLDYYIFADAWGSSVGTANWNPAVDFDSDGVIGFNDYNILGSRWGSTAPWD